MKSGNMRWLNDNKFPLAVFLVLLLIMLTIIVGYKSQGHQLVETMYNAGWLQEYEASINMYPLESYFKQADWLFSETVINLFVTSFFFFLVLIIINILSVVKRQGHIEVHPAEWFYLAAGLFFIQWYFWVMDDAFVLLRYVDNLLFLKNGLVYNKGEYVDGLSSPFMVILTTLLRATEMSWAHIFRLLPIVSFVTFWYMLVRLDRRFAPATAGINFPLAYLTLNYAVLCHFSSWMETPLVHVLAVAYALYLFNPRSLSLQIMLALSPLVRHEMIIPFTIVAIWTWRKHKILPVKMALMMIISVGSWVLFRIYYYADLFPNTFYYKDAINIRQGLMYVHDTFRTYHFYEVTVLALILFYFVKKRGVELILPERVMMIITSLPVLFYVIKIGGDWTHYRYLAFPFVLVTCSFAGILEHFMKEFDLFKYRFTVPLSVAVLSLLFLSFYPVQLKRHPVFLSSIYNNSIPEEKARREYLLDKLKITEAASIMHAGRRINLGYTTDMLSQIKMTGTDTEFKYTETEIGLWCETDYENIRKRIIHGWGLTDAILARIKVNLRGMSGHSPVLHFAQDILNIQRSSEYIGRGMYRKAVEEGVAPEWVKKNLYTIEVIERKIYNNHDFQENLKLAFTFPPKITP
ncbi:hypothetical protein C4544_04810 [candidate division WS5 bacterium]|uniref:Uncharacterized protein n=1 Tax=candidate division WS5 bacterium TaxID=2093353 RepID=A0A419DC07_9BACT|nr:MAG: hypothetical protein C4544_04810 [candidate division WS5 bacterium]